jgi:hypothetical protein
VSNIPEFAAAFNCSKKAKVKQFLLIIMFIALIVFILVKSSNRQKVYILGLTVVMSSASIFLNKYYYKTPFVLGTSSDPVFSIACLMARANALKADSALHATNL